MSRIHSYAEQIGSMPEVSPGDGFHGLVFEYSRHLNGSLPTERSAACAGSHVASCRISISYPSRRRNQGNGKAKKRLTLIFPPIHARRAVLGTPPPWGRTGIQRTGCSSPLVSTSISTAARRKTRRHHIIVSGFQLFCSSTEAF